jgi:hypothetical protein
LFFLLCQLLPAQPTGNPQKDIDQMNAAFLDLKSCYYGERAGQALSWEESETLFKNAVAKVKAFKGTYGGRYPIFFFLAGHLSASIDNDPYNACWNLHNAKTNYFDLSKKPRIEAQKIRNSYRANFGIDSSAILDFYKSKYCADLGVSLQTACPSRVNNTPVTPKTEPEPREKMRTEPVKANTKLEKSEFQSGGFIAVTDTMTFMRLPNGEGFKDPNPVELLRSVLSMKYSSDILEIEEMMPGDARLVPGQNGVPYEVRLKNAKTKEIIHFKAGEYYIEDKSMEEQDQYWTNYQKSYSELSQLVIWILHKYGNDAFHIFVQGSADRPTFSPRPLHPGYPSEEFTQMQFLTVNTREKTVTPGGRVIPGKYNNQDLPDLRGAFIRYMMLQNNGLKPWGSRITQVGGSVKPYDDAGKRNCCIIIYIDWDTALNR